jgi:exodeoxyribonuclease VII large subunit
MLGNKTGEDPQMQLALHPARNVFSVTELNAALQRVLERDFARIWVAGEISGCRMAASGHYYFSLKDRQSQLKCVLFKGSARFARFKPQDGLAVIARGTVEVYEARGEYQFLVELLEPQGVGALQLAFEQLKKQLAAEGLFEPSRKRSLPAFPTNIAVVTSPAGAVIRDIIQVLERRFPGLHVRLFPAQVQGEGAVDQICRGIQQFSDGGWADVVIVARGGGSLEDLTAFNSEGVARAIASSSVPVISAVGHETDFTIADFVADLRAPTPSAAAELVVRSRESVTEQLLGQRAKMVQAARYGLLVRARKLHDCGMERALALFGRLVRSRAQRLDETDGNLKELQAHSLESLRTKLEALLRSLDAADLHLRFGRDRRTNEVLQDRLRNAIRLRLWRQLRAYESSLAHLTQLSPLAVLARGYAIVEHLDRRVIRAAGETVTGEQVRIRLGLGELEAVVSAVHESTS